MSRSTSYTLAAVLLVACSSGTPEGTPDTPVDRTKEAPVVAKAAPSLVIPADVSVPTLPNAAPLVADAPQLTLRTSGVRIRDRSLVEADLSDLAARSENEAKIAGPLRAALDEAAQGAAGRPLLVIAEGSVTFASLRLALEIARAAGFERMGLVVRTDLEVYSMLPMRIAGDAAIEAPAGAIDLRVALRPDGYDVTVGPPTPSEPGAPPTPPTIPLKDESGPLYKAISHDRDALEATTIELLQGAAVKRVTVRVDDGLVVDDLITALQALRGHDCRGDDDPACHVHEVVLSTQALFVPDPKLGIGVIGGKGFGTGSAPGKPPPLMPTVEGPLLPEIVRRIGRAHRKEIQACYEAALARNAGIGGRIDVEFTITGAGKVKGAKIGESNVDDPRLGPCIVREVKTWTFPAPDGGLEVKVTYPIELASE